MQTGPENPMAVVGESNEFCLSGGFGIFILVLAFILIFVTFALSVLFYLERKSHNELKKGKKDNLTEREQILIGQYRKLKERDKHIIEDTLNTLIVNNSSKDDGN